MKLSYAIISGLCASFASLFGKLSGLEFLLINSELRFIVKAACFCLMILLNSLMWTFFVKALHRSKTSVEATAVSTATNYAFSGILGYLVFREVTGLLWWLGIGLVCLGVIMISGNSSNSQSENRND